MTPKDKVNLAMAWYDSGFEDRAAFQTLMESILEQPPQRTEQEPVALPCCGYTDASAIKWNSFNGVVQCHNCGQTYTPSQRTWVGLTDEERSQLVTLHHGWNEYAQAIEAKLKEKNT
jgi:hypothetical protein